MVYTDGIISTTHQIVNYHYPFLPSPKFPNTLQLRFITVNSSMEQW